MDGGLRRLVCDLGLRSDEGVYPRLQTHGHLDLSHPRQMWPRGNARPRPMVKRCSDRIRIGSNASFLRGRSEEHTSELQSLRHLVCRLLLEKKKKETSR